MWETWVRSLGWEDPLEKGKDYPLQYSVLENSMDYTVHGILQARILEWVAFTLLQGIFPTQGSNQGLLDCRQILYQLNYQGSLGPHKAQVKLLTEVGCYLEAVGTNPLPCEFHLLANSVPYSVGCLHAGSRGGGWVSTLSEATTGNSLAVQWLGLCASIVWGLGWILGQGTKIPQGQKKGHCIPHHTGLFLSKPARAPVLLMLHTLTSSSATCWRNLS